LAGEYPGRGWWWEELKEPKKPPAGQNTKKALKIYTSEMFFEEYIYFKIFG
jgi:hypothetical protein